jgi:hypothetical protein
VAEVVRVKESQPLKPISLCPNKYTVPIMSVFEPKAILTLLKNLAAVSPLEKNVFEKDWKASVSFFCLWA